MISLLFLIIYNNKKIKEIIGFENNLFKDKTIEKEGNPYHLNNIVFRYYSILKNENIKTNHEETLVLKPDQTYLPIEIDTMKINWQNQPSYMIMIRDITERKKMLDMLMKAQIRYQELIENIPIGVYRSTPDNEGKYIEVNPYIVNLLECKTKEELLSYSVSSFYKSTNKRKMINEKLLKDGFIKNEEVELISLKGREFWASMSATKKQDLKGNIYFDGTIEDISDRVKAKQRLLESEENFKALAEFSIDGIIILHDNKILYINKQITSILGYEKNELVGKNLKPSNNIYDIHNIYETYSELFIAAQDHENYETILMNKKNQPINVDMAIIKIHWNEKNSHMIIIRDITERKLNQSKLEKYTLQIESDLIEKNKNLKKAQEIQIKLNTEVLPQFKDIKLSTIYMPSESLGGDFFNIHKEQNKLIIIIADCTGHGIDAAMDSILAKSLTDRHLKYLIHLQPQLFLKAVNNDILEYFQGLNFMTMFAGVLDIDNKVFYYANANSELPYLKRDKIVTQIKKPKGIHLGFSKDFNYEKSDVHLKNNDLLFFCSDAIKEIKIKGELFGKDGIKNLVKNLVNTFNFDISYILDE